MQLNMCSPADAVASHVDYAFVRLEIQCWRVSHVDLMAFVREERRIGL